MKVNKLIKILQELSEENGDLEVYTVDREYGNEMVSQVSFEMIHDGFERSRKTNRLTQKPIKKSGIVIAPY